MRPLPVHRTVHGRLHWRIYLAVLASVAAVALLSAGAFHLSGGGLGGENLETIAGIASEILPGASEPAGKQQSALERWHARTHASFALYFADGRFIASAGEPLPAPPPSWTASGLYRSGLRGPLFGLRLPDGRWLVARHPHRAGAAFGFLTLLVVVAAAVGLVAYPISRRLTRRLWRLEESVDALGAGDLAVRVPVEGKDEVARLAAAFNRAASRIEGLVAAQKRLLANASHELRSPLARMKVAASLLEGDAALKDEIARDIVELDGLVEEILLASRLEAGSEEETESVDLTGLAAEESARGGALFQGELVTASGSSRLLRRMLRNLVENARLHGGDGAIEVALSRLPDGYARIDVLDRGPGVPEEARERIFEPFARLPGSPGTGSGQAPGTGLGLSLARQVARRHGGDVVVLPREGGGSRFRATVRASS
jgi:signal transduction histidine kinase